MTCCNNTFKVLDAVGLQLCLSKLEPSAEEFDDPQTRLVWCTRVLSIRTSAENMISNLSQYGPKTTHILRNCRCVDELFIEKISSEPKIGRYLPR